MRNLVKIQLAFLVAAVLFGTLAGSSTPHPDAAPAQNAGCHEHGQAPKQDPVSYACCQTGHGVALLRAADPVQRQLGMVVGAPTMIEPPSAPDTARTVPSVARNTGDPPHPLPLRI